MVIPAPVPDLDDRALDAELYASVTSLDPDQVPDEARVMLGWSRQRAERDSGVAHEVITLLPDVYAAWGEGLIDEAKARICHTYPADLAAHERAAVWAAVAPRVAGWNTGQLAARLRKLTLGSCPEKAEERYARAVQARRAVWFLKPDGTAYLALEGVAPGDAAAAKKRITALARRLRRAGVPGTLDQLRADITLALLDGTLDGLTSEQILTHFRPTTSGGRSDPSPTDLPIVRSDIAPSGPAPRDPTAPVTAQPSAAEPDTAEPDAAGPEAAGPGGAGSRPGTDVVLELGTLIGMDRRPGELPDPDPPF